MRLRKLPVQPVPVRDPADRRVAAQDRRAGQRRGQRGRLVLWILLLFAYCGLFIALGIALKVNSDNVREARERGRDNCLSSIENRQLNHRSDVDLIHAFGLEADTPVPPTLTPSQRKAFLALKKILITDPQLPPCAKNYPDLQALQPG